MSNAPQTGSAPAPGGGSSHTRQLTPLLVWAVVFADIGTSVYYVPGILHATVGDAAPIFVAAALLGFVLLAAKYVEICWRNPEGGGVVTVATEAFSPTWGAVGGILICLDYFLTAAISSVAGIEYLGTFLPALDQHVVVFSILILALLATVNIIGIRESATLALVMAVLALGVDLALVVRVLISADASDWERIGENLSLARELDPHTFLIGFGGAWLAFSGLESISQLSPAMRLPILGTAARGMRFVIVTVLLTSPILTLLSVALLPAEVKAADHEHFISALALAAGGRHVELAVVLSASTLLLFAANTAIIGSYHVFLALAKGNYMPTAVATRGKRFRTPHLAILVASGVPVLVVLITRGDLVALGNLYAFGLLGAFVLSSIGLDVIRWRERSRGRVFVLGLLTSLMVVAAWMVNLHEKHDATFFGSILVGIGMLLALGTRQRVFTDLMQLVPWVARRVKGNIAESEKELESTEGIELLSVSQAESLAVLYPSSTLVALRAPNDSLVREAILRERGKGGTAIYAVFVEERTGLFVGNVGQEPLTECVQTMRSALGVAAREKFTLLPVWTASYNAVEGILRAAEALEVDAVMVGATQRGTIYRMLRGHVFSGLTRGLPSDVRLILQG